MSPRRSATMSFILRLGTPLSLAFLTLFRHRVAGDGSNHVRGAGAGLPRGLVRLDVWQQRHGDQPITARPWARATSHRIPHPGAKPFSGSRRRPDGPGRLSRRRALQHTLCGQRCRAGCRLWTHSRRLKGFCLQLLGQRVAWPGGVSRPQLRPRHQRRGVRWSAAARPPGARKRSCGASRPDCASWEISLEARTTASPTASTMPGSSSAPAPRPRGCRRSSGVSLTACVGWRCRPASAIAWPQPSTTTIPRGSSGTAIPRQRQNPTSGAPRPALRPKAWDTCPEGPRGTTRGASTTRARSSVRSMQPTAQPALFCMSRGAPRAWSGSRT